MPSGEGKKEKTGRHGVEGRLGEHPEVTKDSGKGGWTEEWMRLG